MTLAEKVKSVEEVFQALSSEVATFQDWSGLKCTPGCGKCCIKPDIDATILEFLPFAFHLYKENKALEFYERIKENPSSICAGLDPVRTGGMCSIYAHRGLICRLFGFSARINKHGKAEMLTCNVIKTEQATPYQQAVVVIGVGDKSIPIMAKYYMQLMAIDRELSHTAYPINIAIKKAIEEVLHYYAYREGEE